jgi:hypothetical protein
LIDIEILQTSWLSNPIELGRQESGRYTFSHRINMEASSPLAAMRQSILPSWARNDMYTSHPHAMARGFGPGSFNFHDLSMKRSKKPDYFQMKPVRGSSPTASLAADLSQNFHIDMRYASELSFTDATNKVTALNYQHLVDRSLHQIFLVLWMVVVRMV